MSNKNLSNITNLIQSPSPSSPQTAGMIVPFAGSVAPSGWAICDGSTLSIATYGQLYGRIGTTWNTCTNPLTGVAYIAPAGGNFRIPDLRGTFLRGVGDFTDNTKDTTLAGFQTDQFQGHEHYVPDNYNGGQANNWVLNLSDGNTYFSPSVGITSNGSNGTPRIGNETRPQNVGVNYLIKLYDDAGSIVMSGSPFIGSEFQPSPIVISGNNTLETSKFYTIDSASASTQTLPAATGSNKVVTIENTGTGLVTVDGNASETINGSLNQVIGQYQSLKLRDYASGKWIVMH